LSKAYYFPRLLQIPNFRFEDIIITKEEDYDDYSERLYQYKEEVRRFEKYESGDDMHSLS
jgi:hypothetical protein